MSRGVVRWLEGPASASPRIADAAAEAAALRELADRLAARDDPAPDSTVSVVICTRDRPRELTSCLAALREQSRVPDEVIVVDNAPKDAAVERLARASGAVYVCEPRPGLDIARNAGARRATGDIIVYTDDDVLPHRRWLERMVCAFADARIDAATGLVLPAELETEAQLHFERYWSFCRGLERIDFGREFFAMDRRYGCPAWEIGAGASMAFRRSCFKTAGWFDERLDVGAAGCSGDSEYWHRILSVGGVIRYEPFAVAFHVHRRDIDGLRRQLRAYMRGHAAALLVQYERTGNLGNLRRVLLTTPSWYARRALRAAVGGRRARDRFLWDEIAGYASGVWFYLRTPRSAAGGA